MKKFISAGLSILFLCTLFMPFHFTASAASDSPWFSQAQALKKSASIPDNTSIFNLAELKTCEDRAFLIQPPSALQPAQYTYPCAHKARFGYVAGKYIHIDGTRVAGKISDSAGVTGLIPVSDTNDVLGITSLPSVGWRVRLFKDLPHNIVASAGTVGQLAYSTPNPYGTVIKDKSGAELLLHPSSISFSPNGKYLVADVPGVSYIRVDLETLEVTPFAYSYNYFGGYPVTPRASISNDGRYAVAYAVDLARFELYDLNGCEAAPNKITKAVNCPVKNMHAVMSSFAVDYGGTYLNFNVPKFLGNDTISLLATYRDAQNVRKPGRFTLSASASSASRMSYLALGDSFSSGEGANDYEAYTNTNDNVCHTSKNSYGYLIAQKLSLSDFKSVACSGAIVSDILNNGPEYLGQTKTKLTRLERNQQAPGFIESVRNNFFPGYVNQLEFVQTHKPKNITVSIGGNDIGFSDILVRCIVFEPTCYNTYEDRYEVVTAINEQYVKFTDTLRLLKQSSPADTNIYVVGYPRFADNGACGFNVRLNSEEIDFGNKIVAHLNGMIKRSAEKEGVVYADIENSLEGGRLCSGSKDIDSTLHGITLGRDRYGVLSASSFHPTKKGQSQMHQAVLDATNYFTKTSPVANPLLTAMPDITEANPLLQMPKTGRTISKTIFTRDIEDELFVREQDNYIQIGDVLLERNSTYDVWVHSTPTYLGNLSTDNAGELFGNIQIPNSVEPGFHTLHIYGKNIAGESIDIQKLIYVAASSTDYDGDGTNNATDTCIGFDTVDIDNDNIDDMCDSEFTVQEEIETPEDTVEQPETIETPTEPEENNPVLLEDDPKDTLINQPSESSPENELRDDTIAPNETAPAPPAPTPRRTIAVAPTPTPTPEPQTASVAGASTTLAQTSPQTTESVDDLINNQTATQQSSFSFLGYLVLFVVLIAFVLFFYRLSKRNQQL